MVKKPVNCDPDAVLLSTDQPVCLRDITWAFEPAGTRQSNCRLIIHCTLSITTDFERKALDAPRSHSRFRRRASCPFPPASYARTSSHISDTCFAADGHPYISRLSGLICKRFTITHRRRLPARAVAGGQDLDQAQLGLYPDHRPLAGSSIGLATYQNTARTAAPWWL